MRIECPHCGERDLREFYYQGDATLAKRPAADAGEDAWDHYVHLRKNPAGVTSELWCHERGCGAWIVVERNTTTHAITSTKLVGDF